MRRCGWLDAAALKRSMIINGISGLCITKLDVLDGLPEIRVCTGYRLGGRELDILPLDADEIASVSPSTKPCRAGPEHRGADQLGTTADQRPALPGTHAGPDRRAHRHGVHRARPRAHDSAAPPVSRLTLLLNLQRRPKTMLTDDGKHLYVSWDEYHMLIERLALKVHNSGWAFDQILCLARGGMRPGDVLSRVFDKPLAIMSTSSYRSDAGTIQGRLDLAKYITMPKGELAGRVLLVDDLADTGHRCARWSTACGACRPLKNCEPPSYGSKGCRATFPTTSSRRCPRAPGFTSRSKNTMACVPKGLAKKFAV
jgi:hypothetical protein